MNLKLNFKEKKFNKINLNNKNGLILLKISAWILIVLGLIEVLIIFYKFLVGSYYIGGSIVFILAGLLLLKKNLYIYKKISIGACIFTSLIIASVGLDIIIKIFINSINIIPIEFKINNFIILRLVYFFVFPTIIFLLYHPKTRSLFLLKEVSNDPKSLYISFKKLILIPISSLLIISIFIGPYFFKNPFNPILNYLITDNDINNKVGNIKKIELINYSFSNLNFYTKWRIIGEKNYLNNYKIKITPKYKILRLN